MTKEARLNNRYVSSTNGLGETGLPYVENETEPLSHTINKI